MSNEGVIKSIWVFAVFTTIMVVAVAGLVLPREVALANPGSLSGTVSDSTNTKIATVLIEVIDGTNTVVATDTTDASADESSGETDSTDDSDAGDGGCDCRADRDGGGSVWLLGLLGLFARRRRRQ